MVYIKSIKCSGLYSFADEAKLEFSDSSLIVGPNNSGKSNIFRILKLFVYTFSDRKRLENYEIYPTNFEPTLEVDIRLSRYETELIIDFMSFYPDKQNNNSEFYRYNNYDLLQEMLDTVHVKFIWKQEIEDASEPYVQMEFTKCGLKFFAYLFSDFKIFNEFPSDDEKLSFNNEKHLTDILQQITKDDEPKSKISQIFKEIQMPVGLPYLRINRNREGEDEAKKVIRKLYAFTGLSLDTNQQLSFRDLFGTILRTGIRFSSDRRGFVGPNLLDFVNLLKLEAKANPKLEENLDFNTILEQQAFTKSLEFDEELKSDGSNLASYLFSLRNSKKYEDRIKFEKIQRSFEKILTSENLQFDVIIEYEIKKRHIVWATNDKRKPKFPIIVIVDKKLGRQFPLDQVGSGLNEIIYLLTLAYGLEDSVILLDEPSANLHPPLMRTLMKILQNKNTKNQFCIITHSPELVSYQLFENNSDIFYIRRKNKASVVKTPHGEIKEWFTKERDRLKYQIDTKIFFSKAVILTEGESDKNLLSGMANYLESLENELNIAGNDVIITSTGGVKNFKKYISLLETFEIPYKGLVDADAKSLFPKSSIITKNSIHGTEPICVIEGGDLEYFMNNVDSESFSTAKQSHGKSKPSLAFAFTQYTIKKNPQSLKAIQDLLKESIRLSREEKTPE